MEISGQLQVLLAPHPGKLLESQHIKETYFYAEKLKISAHISSCFNS
jgi:hypothetical protein